MADSAPSSTPPQTPLPAGTGLRRLRTYEDDVKQAIQDQQASIATIALAEQKRRNLEQDRQEVETENKKGVALLVVSVMLVVAGIGVAGYFMYFNPNAFTPPQQVEVGVSALVPYESFETIGVGGMSRAAVGQALAARANNTFQYDTVKALVLTKDSAGSSASQAVQIDTAAFFEIIRSEIPDSLLRSLNPLFTYGVYAGESNYPFILLYSSSFESGYGGMLAWESALPRDMASILYDPLVSQTASTSQEVIQKGTYADQVIFNRDARVFIDEAGAPLFYYTFLDNNMILIATEPSVVREIYERIKTAQLVR